MKAGKIWGQTELIHANGVLEFHRIEYKAGYKCSEHEHEFKWNGFFVESGKMIVRVWQNDYDLVDETLLLPGDFTQVKPGCIHQFEGVEDGVAFELYWAEFNHNDIKRRSIGRPVPTKENDRRKNEGEEETPVLEARKFLTDENFETIIKDKLHVPGREMAYSYQPGFTNTTYSFHDYGPQPLHPWHSRAGYGKDKKKEEENGKV